MRPLSKLLREETGGRSQAQLQGLQGLQFSPAAGGRICWDRHSENSWKNGPQLSVCLLSALGTPSSMCTQKKGTQRVCPWVFTGRTLCSQADTTQILASSGQVRGLKGHHPSKQGQSEVTLHPVRGSHQRNLLTRKKPGRKEYNLQDSIYVNYKNRCRIGGDRDPSSSYPRGRGFRGWGRVCSVP